MWSELIKRWLDMMTWWVPNRGNDQGEGQSQGQSKAGPSSKAADSEPKQDATKTAEPAQKKAAPAQNKTAEPSEGASQGPSTSGGTKQSGASGKEDLSQIKGIGPSVRDRLTTLGIHNFQQLGAADAEQLTSQLKEHMVVSQKRVQQWIEEARSRSK